MPRDIKFRAWLKKDGELVQVEDINFTQEIIWTGIRLFYFDEIVLEQYTGLKDKNGREIYEGDIVLTNEAGWKGYITFDYGSFTIIDNYGGFSGDLSDIEVIGNIHENNNMLGGK